MLKPSMRVIPAGDPMTRGRLANIVMLRRLIRDKSTLPRRPLAAPCLTAPCLAAPPHPPRRVSPRCSPRRTAPPAAPHRSSRYRGAFTRPARWHSVSARSEPAQRAISPQQWNRRAITPQQWSQRAITPQQWSQRAGTPRPSFARRNKSRTTPRRIRGDDSA